MLKSWFPVKIFSYSKKAIGTSPTFAMGKANAMAAFQKLHQESRLDFDASEPWLVDNFHRLHGLFICFVIMDLMWFNEET